MVMKAEAAHKQEAPVGGKIMTRPGSPVETPHKAPS